MSSYHTETNDITLANPEGQEMHVIRFSQLDWLAGVACIDSNPWILKDQIITGKFYMCALWVC